jgi:RNA polymerase sigma-70 factor (TIGR02960 family)
VGTEMSLDLLDRAQDGDRQAFDQLVAPHRRELHVFCYRYLGSFTEAEDALQETLLAAWQGLARFERRASLRTWLYRIATSRCLDAARATRRRSSAPEPAPMHEALSPPEPTRLGRMHWLEPYPDALLESLPDPAPGPQARVERAESVSLAFVTALQLLTPGQRVAVILRDVLGFPAAEAAAVAGTSVESLTSALKRGRATLERERRRGSTSAIPRPASALERETVGRLVTAFEAGDVSALVSLLSDDVRMTMPPLPLEYDGPVLAGEFLAATAMRPGWRCRLLPTRANGQPAFGLYARDPRDGSFHTIGLMAVTLDGDRVCALTRFDPRVLPWFGLPDELEPDEATVPVS